MMRLLTAVLSLLSIGHMPAFSQSVLNWTTVHDAPAGGYGIDCNSNGICVVALSTAAGGDCYLLRSSDRGATWDTTYKSPYDISRSILSPSPGDVHFLTDSTVLVQLDSAYVLRSDDAGMTWQRVSVSSFNDGTASHLLKLSPTSAVCVVKYGPRKWTVAPDSTFVSTDGGRSWSPVPVQPKLSNRSATYSIQGLYSNQGGGFGTIVSNSSDTSTTILLTETHDNGSSWIEKVIQTPAPIGVLEVTVRYFDKNTAVLTANAAWDSGLVMRTWDGGATWSTIFFDQINDAEGKPAWTGMLTSTFLDTNYGIAGTRLGIIETNDGGYSWRACRGALYFSVAYYYIDLNNAIGVDGFGTVAVGRRQPSSVVRRDPDVLTPLSLVVNPGDRLDVPRISSGSTAFYRMVDLVGREVASGVVSSGDARIIAPTAPGYYVIMLETNKLSPLTIRILVSP